MALVTWVLIGLVLLLVAVLLVVKITQGTVTVPPPPVGSAQPDVVRAATTVPLSVFDAVGAPGPPVLTPPAVTPGQPALTLNGRPEVLYAGAEFCPYCAAEGWVLVVALSRFGQFGHLGATSSSNAEVFPLTKTFTFDGSTYRSDYVSFTALELYGDQPSGQAPPGFAPIHALTPAERQVLRRYDGWPETGSGAGPMPFVDVANRAIVIGAGTGFSPGLLLAPSASEIAAALRRPSSPVAQAVIGAANELTAAICAATGGRPVEVCATPGVEAGAARLVTP
jgi:hypothetical protein